ncbi:hypothetical protein JCM16303_004694 [Sporobolomyces ruberrimus]
MSSNRVHSALLSIYNSRSTSPTLLSSTTPKILRKSLEKDHGIKYTGEEWSPSIKDEEEGEQGMREVVLRVWIGILEENRSIEISSSPAIIVSGPSSKPFVPPKPTTTSTSSLKSSKKPVAKKEEKNTTKQGETEIILSSSSDHEVQEPEKPTKKKRRTSSTTSTSSLLTSTLKPLKTRKKPQQIESEEEGSANEVSADELVLEDSSSSLNADSSSSLNADTPPPLPIAAPKPKVLKKPRTSTTSTSSTKVTKGKGKGRAKEAEFKSTEFVQDSDDSSNSVVGDKSEERPTAVKEMKKVRKRKSQVVDSDSEDGGNEKESGKSKGKGKAKEVVKKSGANEKETKKKTKKEPVRKEGDAEKGTEQEEERIKKLKNLLKLAGTPRPFTVSTGSERTLSITQRTKILETLLSDLGLFKKGVSGRLPSESKAKEVGTRRELEKETEELQDSTIGKETGRGLRTGKIRRVSHSSSDTSSDDEQADDTEKKEKGKAQKKGGGGSTGTPQRKKMEERKKFASFLGDQEGSESD